MSFKHHKTHSFFSVPQEFTSTSIFPSQKIEHVEYLSNNIIKNVLKLSEVTKRSGMSNINYLGYAIISVSFIEIQHIDSRAKNFACDLPFNEFRCGLISVEFTRIIKDYLMLLCKIAQCQCSNSEEYG